eukprot:Gregarina_sp_Poly_1__7006@NODE_3814_length_871_cov_1718_220149_g1324_i2_p1_GENE_NODE_3814_length_871_cov_1718_220149_g1324_i2NODE_3814_length_871_cov_1718_220149_g1324_i2_p1_ORF_typecomplete_len256_score33_22CoA_binding_2/PF13380_6/5_5e33Succ_CoA_lig/PF13607_6/3_8e03Succ_CoA_lig/PF13607_6/1_4e03Succ_CoA_lig/PF13607_6/0_00062CoA_binding/PF02629_19/0_0076CoA_binding/PF02629_19/1_2e04_NODE_3814_length_871_cov_1718_220149_g1324_i221788
MPTKFGRGRFAFLSCCTTVLVEGFEFRSSLSNSAMSSQFSHITMETMRAVFQPKGVAVVGATERPGSVGRTVVENLQHGYANTGKASDFEIFPVNPTRESVLGIKCYKSVSTVNSDKCEMVVVITPAARCIDVVRDSTQNKAVRVVVVLAAGFKEIGPEGLKLEQDLVQLAREAKIAVIGPNCLGVMVPNWQLNATFAAASASCGSVAFISQSGAMCTAVLDWAISVRGNFYFSVFNCSSGQPRIFCIRLHWIHG